MLMRLQTNLYYILNCDNCTTDTFSFFGVVISLFTSTSHLFIGDFSMDFFFLELTENEILIIGTALLYQTSPQFAFIHAYSQDFIDDNISSSFAGI